VGTREQQETPAVRPDSADSETLMADNEFERLHAAPGTSPAELGWPLFCACVCNAARWARWLPVNEERAGEWIQVDLLSEMTDSHAVSVAEE